jgi:hypothetical protein
MLETITPHQRGNTLDPEVRNPAFRAGRGHEVEREVNMREVVEMLKKTRGFPTKSPMTMLISLTANTTL